MAVDKHITFNFKKKTFIEYVISSVHFQLFFFDLKINTTYNRNIVNRAFTDLLVIAQIPPQGRLCICNGHLTVESNAFWTPLKRWFFMENRHVVLMHLKQLFLDLELFLTNCTSIENWVYQELESISESVKQGLMNMKLTYTDDAQVNASMDLLLARFDYVLTNLVSHKNENNKIKQ